ncbi:MAG TPA: LLM class flavin-dependent oxidoreductase [Chloroflexota bacterium]|nr:LLM class flavin-dependent oxidoreductase [Chloroflexota bacterium]
MAKSNVSIHVPLAAPDVQPNTMVEFARRAEAAGAGGIWTLDRLVFDNQEPLTALAAAAAMTTDMYLGISVLLGTLRPPAMLAKILATLDQLNGGKVIAGLGVGSRPDDFAGAEIPFEHRGSRLEEAIQVVKLCWSGQPVKFSGRFYTIDVGPIGPKPLSGSTLPIWLGGGGSESALKRIGRIADGYIASSSGGPGGFRDKWDAIGRYAEQAGRDPASIYPAGLIYVCVDDDVARAEEVTARYFQHYYAGNRPTRGGAIMGSADACIRGINDYLQAGLRYPIIGMPTADLSHLERFLEKVLPRLES